MNVNTLSLWRSTNPPLTPSPHQRWKRKSRPGRRPDIDFTKSEKAALARSLRCRRAGTLTSSSSAAGDDPAWWEVLRDVDLRGRVHGASPASSAPEQHARELRGRLPGELGSEAIGAAAAQLSPPIKG